MSPNAPVNILIVDDSRDKLMALEVVLEGMDLNLICVQSGVEALRKVTTHDFAAILLDVNMPIMDGFETAQLIRQRSQSECTPIIFVTSHGDDPLIARGYALGAVDYLLTPVVPAVLRTKVGVFADVYRKTRQIRHQARHLQQRADQLAALAAELADAEHRERRRLAQSLHDNLQQMLVAARFRIGTYRSVLPDERDGIIAEVDDLLHQSITASRTLTAELSPPILFDAGLVPALEWLSRRMKKTHDMEVEVRSAANIDFSTDTMRSFAFTAIRELLVNCHKHSGCTEAGVHLTRGKDDRVQIVVSDAGKGFDPAILESSAIDRDSFGLFNIRERVAYLKGNFDIVSARGRGTTVTLTLPDPVQAVDAPHPVTVNPPAGTAPGPSAPRQSTNGAAIRVVIADDHETIRKGLVAYLAQQNGIEVIGEAADGSKAIEISRTLHPDVILMDVSMPVMNGIEATRIIKSENTSVRVIALSMHKGEDMAAAMSLAGASLYLPKDGPPEVLVEAIRECDDADVAVEAVPPS